MDENKNYSQNNIDKTITDRIGLLLEQKGLNRKSFADRIKENPSKLSHIFTGRNNPSLDLIQKILNAFPDVSADWLLRGDGLDVESFSKGAQTNNFPNNQPISDMEANNADVLPLQATHKKNMDAAVRSFQSDASTKKIQKIIILYDDGSFEER